MIELQKCNMKCSHATLPYVLYVILITGRIGENPIRPVTRVQNIIPSWRGMVKSHQESEDLRIFMRISGGSPRFSSKSAQFGVKSVYNDCLQIPKKCTPTTWRRGGIEVLVSDLQKGSAVGSRTFPNFQNCSSATLSTAPRWTSGRLAVCWPSWSQVKPSGRVEATSTSSTSLGKL